MRTTRTLTALLVAVTLLTTVAPASSAGPSTRTGQDGSAHHVVRPGDTVVSIARLHGVDPDVLRRANGIVEDRLYVGARVLLSDPNGGVTPPMPSRRISHVSEPATSTGSTYTVREGDVLARIARRHGVSLSALLSANGLDPEQFIMVGDRLEIPGGSTDGGSSPATGPTYTVRDGDVLARIARRHGVSLSALLSANDLEADDLIMEGDQLQVPGGRRDAVTTSAAQPELVCPVPGASFMNDWGFPRGGHRFHEGTDLFAASGTTIVAPTSGTVSFGSNGLGGTTFTLATDGGWVFYGAHLDDTIGSPGRVAAGTPIGTVGDSGNAAGGDPHLHLGLKPAGGHAVNPYPSIAAACG
jgi:LysM repeat protein